VRFARVETSKRREILKRELSGILPVSIKMLGTCRFPKPDFILYFKIKRKILIQKKVTT
jgi:hypothetical protein